MSKETTIKLTVKTTHGKKYKFKEQRGEISRAVSRLILHIPEEIKEIKIEA